MIAWLAQKLPVTPTFGEIIYTHIVMFVLGGWLGVTWVVLRRKYWQ